MRWLFAVSVMGCLLGSALAAQEPEGRAPSLDELRVLARRDSNDAVVQYQLGVALWDRKRWDEAEQAFRDALVVAPSYADAHLALGILPQRRGAGYWKGRLRKDGEARVRTELLESEAHYRRALLLNPLVDLRLMGKVESPEAGFYRVGNRVVMVLAPWWSGDLARCANQLREGDYWKAFEKLQQLEADSRFGGQDVDVAGPVLELHGLAAAHLNRFDEAIRDFAILTGRALSRESDSTAELASPLRSNDYRFILATLLYLASRYDQAVPTFQRALELDVGLYVAHVQLARIYEADGQLEEALRERQAAVDAAPDDPDVLVDLAGTLLKAGRIAEAESPLEEAARINPRDPRIAYLQGAVADRLGQAERARTAYTRFLGLAPSRFAPQIEEVRLHLAGGSPSQPPRR
jgi:tetratricopeptide (TPR) repeat protein